MKKFNITKKQRIVITILLILALCAVITVIIDVQRNQNRFDITSKDSFNLIQNLYLTGYDENKSQDLSWAEKRQILGFLKNLKYEEALKINPPLSEVMVGVPSTFIVNRKEGRVVFSLYSVSNVETLEFDKNDQMISRQRYSTTADQMNKIHSLIKKVDKETIVGQ